MNSARAAFSIVLIAHVARADPKAAEASFARGLELYDAHRYEEACAAFAESLHEDFQYGALYNLADCDEKRGHLASALREYERLASEDTNARRREDSASKASKLAPRVPKIVVSADARPGLVVLLDDDDVTAKIGSELPVDLGAHVVRARLPGQPERKIDASVPRERELVRVEVAFETALPPPPPPSTPRSRTLEKTLLIGGGALLASGLVAGGVALYRWHSSEAEAKLDNQHELARADSARTWGNVSTLLCIAGAATVGTGVVLWRHAGSDATVHVAPGGVAVSGHFE
jgi:tetratricopeptide (TPR) repeat protein